MILESNFRFYISFISVFSFIILTFLKCDTYVYERFMSLYVLFTILSGYKYTDLLGNKK